MPVNTNSDSQHGFWLMGTRVRLLNIHMTPTACCGLMCDAIDTNHKRCACYVASDSQASIVLCLQLQIVPPSTGGKEFTVQNFTSKNFTRLCMKDGIIPKSVTANEFTQTRRIKTKLTQSIVEILNHGNSNGGWTAMGWVRRGAVRDEAHLQDPNIRKAGMVRATTLTHHITLLMPTCSTVSNDMAFDVKSLRQPIHARNGDQVQAHDVLAQGNLPNKRKDCL